MSIQRVAVTQESAPVIKTMLSICPNVRKHVLDLAKQKFSNVGQICPDQLGDFLLKAYDEAKFLPSSNIVEVEEKTDIPEDFNFGKVLIIKLADHSIVNISAKQYRRLL